MFDYPQRIQALRIERGLSVTEVAEEAGVREVCVRGIESGRYKPTFDLAIRIARALDVTLNDLVSMA